MWIGLYFVIFWNKECRADLLVMGGPEVFGKIVTNVFTIMLSVNEEVTLFHMVCYLQCQ